MIDWIQNYSDLISLASSILLLLVTGVYVYLTKRILEASQIASRLALNPVIGIEVGDIQIGEVYGKARRRNMGVGLKLTNVGNAPAIEVLIDAEIILAYSQINGEKSIPSRFAPQMVSFIRPGQTLDDDSASFGNTLITHLFDDYREKHRLNIHRIETDPTREAYKASQLRIIISYRNSVGQYFESQYSTHLDLGEELTLNLNIPKDDEKTKMIQIYIPRPQFNACPIDTDVLRRQQEERNTRRQLCGW